MIKTELSAVINLSIEKSLPMGAYIIIALHCFNRQQGKNSMGFTVIIRLIPLMKSAHFSFLNEECIQNFIHHKRDMQQITQESFSYFLTEVNFVKGLYCRLTL